MNTTLTQKIVLLFSIISLTCTTAVAQECKTDTSIDYNFIKGTEIKVPTRRVIYTYNDDGKATISLTQNWDNENNKWLNQYRSSYTYREIDNAEEVIRTFFRWNTDTNEWLRNSRETKSYNGDIQILYFSENWISDLEEWVFNAKYEDEINADGQYTSQRVFDKSGDEIYLLSETTYTYDNQGRKLTELRKRDFSGDLRNSSRVLYSYTPNTQEQVIQRWINSELEWQNNSRTLYDLDTADFHTEEIRYNWDVTIGNWIHTQRFERSYNKEYLDTFYLYQRWNNTLNEWENDSKKNITYTSFNEKETEGNYSWVEANTEWVKSNVLDFQYNSEGLNTLVRNTDYRSGTPKIILEFIYEYNEIGTQIAFERRYSQDPVTKAWNSRTREEKICTITKDETASIWEAEQEKTTLYPNPISGKTLYINVKEQSTYTLSNQLGNTVKTGKLVRGNNKIEIESALVNGLYILRVNNLTQKLILNR